VLHRPERGEDADVLIVAVGPFASLALDTAARLSQQGIGSTVVDPRWVLPVPESIAGLAQAHRLVVTVEDGGVHGGVGSSVSEKLRAENISTPVRDVGIEQRFLSHASRGELLDELGLTAQDVARAITAMVSSMQAPLSSADEEDLNDIS
jgi:1-deoxy-D-xylulose-5-phosphate synthase